MKEEAYFRQAAQDIAFRRLKIEELTYLRKFSLATLVFVVLLLTGLYVGVGLSWSDWASGMSDGWLVFLLLAWNYSRLGTLLSALRAMDAREPELPRGGQERVTI